VLTDNLSALCRWMVAGSEVARPIEEFQDQNQHRRRQTADTRHHGQTPSVLASFLKDVRSLVGVIEGLGNPFEEESQDVFKLDTKEIVYPAVYPIVVGYLCRWSSTEQKMYKTPRILPFPTT